MNKATLGILITLLGAIAYGVYPVALRAAYIDNVSPAFIMVIVTWSRAICLSASCLLIRNPLFSSTADTKTAATSGFFQALSGIGIFYSLLYLSAPVMICIIFTQTLMQLFYMIWRGEAKFDIAVLASTIMAIVGLTIVLDVWHAQTIQWLGVLLALMAAVATASRIYIYGKQAQSRHAFVIGAESFLIAAILLTPFLFFQDISLPHSTESWIWIIAACLSTIAGSFCMFSSISLIGSFSYSMFAKLEPIFTAIFSVLFINEILEWHQYAGILIVIGSLIAYQYLSSRKS